MSTWSPERRQAASARMKAMQAAKQASKDQEGTPVPPEAMSHNDEPVSREEYSDLMQRFRELEGRVESGQISSLSVGFEKPRISDSGRLVGTLEKYKLDPAYYDDPRLRLAAEARLRRFAFRENYTLDWLVQSTFYETIDGIKTREPRFELTLNRIVMNEDTGEPTQGRYVIRKLIFHEDPQAALIVAREHGLPIDESDERQFLDEMRYLRARDWLFEVFYPAKSTAKKSKKEMVIGNRLVDYYEINSENAEKMPFDDLNKRL